MQSCDELHVVRIDLAAKKNSGDLKRAREALQSRRIDFGPSITFAWYPKVTRSGPKIPAVGQFGRGDILDLSNEHSTRLSVSLDSMIQ